MFVFTCKLDAENHKPHFRPREKTSEGTANLKTGLEGCNKRRGIATATPGEIASGSSTPYSAAVHRALIALRCATSQRPFTCVLDEYYRAEVQLLRPGTILPSPSTVSRDICSIYLDMAKYVRDYFKVMFDQIIHVCISILTHFCSAAIIQSIWL